MYAIRSYYVHGVAEAERNARIREAIERTDLTAKATDPIANLSRGYRQRVGVAQAILHLPRLLILDEPTNGLDPTQVQQMRSLIRALAEHATVILSTHVLQEVQAICDRVIIIRNGQIALDASMNELRAGKRLLVALDAAPEQALPLLQGVDGVAAVEALEGQESGYGYALNLATGGELFETAPQVASRVAEQGMKLYSYNFV